jgi:hypothetical protein
MKYLIIVLLLCLLIIPVHADSVLSYQKNSTTIYSGNSTIYESDWFAQQGYVPVYLVIFTIILGSFFTGLSLVSPRRVVPALIAPLFWGYAAWNSIYMFDLYITSNNAIFNVMQVVYADGLLRTILIAITIITVLYAIYVVFLEPNESNNKGPVKPPA